MPHKNDSALHTGMRTSPWIILGSTAILVIVVMALAFRNTNREERYVVELLTEKGAALIRAVEAGARTGMIGMMWGGKQIQRLLEETGRLPDVLYMAVIDQNGLVLAHSDPSRIGTPFDARRRIIHLGSDEQENWEMISQDDQQHVFEVHRHFRPMTPDGRKNFAQMQAMMQNNGIPPETSQDWFAPQNRKNLLIIVGMDTTPLEETGRHETQTTVLLSVVMLLLGFGGFVSLFWMHNYKAAKRSLKDTSAFASEIVSHLPVGLIATDRSGQVTFFNTAAEGMTHLERSVVQDQKPDEFLPQGLSSFQGRLDKGEMIIDQEMECTFSGNRMLPVSVSATRIINGEGDFLGHVLIMKDLSEIRRLQEKVRKQEKLAAMGGLAAGVAHEVRNPLSSIKALATFFSQQFDQGSEAQEAAVVMVQEVDRLNRVITELLEISRPADIKKQSCDMGFLISRSIQLIQQDARSKHIDIKVNLDECIDQCWVDPDRLTQCLLNLYLNGIQSMGDGGCLSVDCATGPAGSINLTISDTGTGISPGDLDKIFDPYFTTKSRGTGLGLAIVHKIVEAHQGQVSVKSRVGHGTSFTLQLPGKPTSRDRSNDDIT
ncbi:MAG: ATP-binding protein [Pseudomonadota bacterium]